MQANVLALVLISERNPTMTLDDAIMILRRRGYQRHDIAAHIDEAVKIAESFQLTHVARDPR